jgi:hypothetical protein
MNARFKKRARWLCTMAMGAMVIAPSVPAAEPKPDDAGMAMIRERNIFDPNRRAGRRSEEPREASAPVRAQVLALTGTMLHSGRALAFFGGSESEYRKVITVGDQVGRFTVERIARGEVELSGGDERFVLEVGRNLRRSGDGAWQKSEERYAAAAAPVASSGAEQGKTPTPVEAAVPAADGAGEVMRRMMERRRQEE